MTQPNHSLSDAQHQRAASTPALWVSKAVFGDESQLQFGRRDIVVLVGPNNSGKSEALRNIRDKLAQPTNVGRAITSLVAEREGSVEQLTDWLKLTCREVGPPQAPPNNHAFSRGGQSVHNSQLRSWQNPHHPLNDLAGFFCHHLSADDRLRAAEPPNNIALTRDPLTHPIHYLQADDEVEASISKRFRDAFGMDLVVHRNAGATVPLYCGDRPIPKAGKDRVSRDYIEQLEKLAPVHLQGDGVRAFVGILLFAAVMPHSILLIDEPEAFLHPPQIRQLARAIATDIGDSKQVFIATHSGDFLRALIDANAARVRVVRLRRDGEHNRVKELDGGKIQELWADPLLRYSNVLDGLFHDRVIVAESDSDCRFYSAVKDAVFREKAGSVPDVMFTHCGGKSRLSVVVQALRHLDVPIAAIADIDILNDEQPLRTLFEAFGGVWTDIQAEWQLVKSAIDQKKAETGSKEVCESITKILAGVTGSTFPRHATREIEKVLKRSSAWSIVKESGKAYIPAGDATQAYERMNRVLKKRGLFVVEVGELEGFARSIGNHGPKWVNAVLQKDLQEEEFAQARSFVKALCEWKPGQ